MKLINETDAAFKYFLKLQVVVSIFLQVHDPKCQQVYPPALHFDESITEYSGTRINTENDFFRLVQILSFFDGKVMAILLLAPALSAVVLYALLQGLFLRGWHRCPVVLSPRKPAFVSILVPFRDEAMRIRPLIACLRNQDYPAELFEVIFIDDHSTDDGPSLVAEAIETGLRGKLVPLADGAGKKAALREGLSHIRGTYLATVDADVCLPAGWLRSWATGLDGSGADMLILPVMCPPGRQAAGHFQVLEFLGLQFATLGAAGAGFPLMCNGANLVFRTDFFRSHRAAAGSQHASGDDMFMLLEAIRSKAMVHVLRNRDAIAIVAPASSWREVFTQRLRWASKTGHYTPGTVLTVALLVWLTNTVCAGAMAAVVAGAPWPWLGIPVMKMLCELPGLAAGARWFHRTSSLVWWLPISLLYPFYATLVPVVAHFSPPHWKDRPLKTLHQLPA